MALTARDLSNLLPEQRQAVLAGMSPEELAHLEHTWSFWARPDQLAPEGNWRTWLLLGGRGSGKTRAAAEWVRGEIESGRRRQIGVVGPTVEAVRRIQIEGPSGILAVTPSWAKPEYQTTMRRLVYPNGAMVHLFSAEEPDRLRGPNLDGAWCDEIATWPENVTTWNVLQMAVRVAGPQGHVPRVLISTTPRPQALLREIMQSSSTVTTKTRTSDNAANLDAATLSYLKERHGGTRLGRQELDAELLGDADGALWTRDLIEECRLSAQALPELVRVVTAIDPSGGGTDECGLVVCGRGADGHGYVLQDASGRYSPERWAARAIALHETHHGDRIVAEQNYGGEMVRATLRAVDPSVPVRLVHASRGKAIRAEPVAALFEQHKVHLVGAFEQLEDQLCTWVPGEPGRSPDRLDALVWAITDLMLRQLQPPSMLMPIGYYSARDGMVTNTGRGAFGESWQNWVSRQKAMLDPPGTIRWMGN